MGVNVIEYERLCARQPNALRGFAGGRYAAPAVTGQNVTLPNVLPFAMLEKSRGTAEAKSRACFRRVAHHFGPDDERAWTRGLEPVRVVSRQPDALWKVRWQSPVWLTARRVCPRGCDASPRGQIHQLASKLLCLPACPCARA